VRSNVPSLAIDNLLAATRIDDGTNDYSDAGLLAHKRVKWVNRGKV